MAWFPGENALIRLWDTVERIGTGLASPLQIRREGKARADVRKYEMLAEAEARREIEEIAGGRLGFDQAGHLTSITANTSDRPLLAAPNSPTQEKCIVPEPETPSVNVSPETQELLFRARVANGLEGLRRLTNLRATVRQAEEEMESGVEIESETPDPINEDWLSSWREGAERVSQADLQRLWARILKSEVSRPGAISLRTLLFMRGLDKVDADLISQLGPFVLDGEVVIVKREALKREGMGTDELLSLEDMGVLSGVTAGFTGLQRTMEVSREKSEAVQLPGGEAIVVRAAKETRISDQCYVVTRVGREVLALGNFEPNETYLDAVISGWKCENVSLQRAKIIERRGDGRLKLADVREI